VSLDAKSGLITVKGGDYPSQEIFKAERITKIDGKEIINCK
jgi:hypothetical protein